MKAATAFTLFGLLCLATVAQSAEQRKNVGSVTGGDSKKAQTIINSKCTVCHSRDKIDVALSSGKDMSIIQKDMEKRGVHLSSKEREVLGIFWKHSKPISKQQ